MKKGITLKIFCITSILLVVSALIIYLTLYFLLPNYYYNYKNASLSEGTDQLVEKVESSPIEDVEALLNQFVESNNIRLVIQNQHGYVIYLPMDQYVRDGLSNGRNPFSGRHSLNPRQLEENWHNQNMITVSTPVSFQGDPYKYILTASAPLQPIDEASKVLILILPYMLIVIGLISIIGAFVYSNLISKPLLELNKTAKIMAQLDFTTESKINTNDELGELSLSLNKLSTNLQENMDELKKANEKLKDDIQKEREQESRRREFVATISHELKTPITAVSGQLEGMIHEIGAYKDRDKYLKQSYSILNNMEKLVHEILDVSQLESFDFAPNIQRINLSNLVLKTIENYYYFIEEKQLKLHKFIDDDVMINGDEKLIGKALSNILSNAIKYTADGEKIEIKLGAHDRDIRLTVMNANKHIDEEHLEKIFEPFYRIEKSRNRKTGGSGLGLYIVKKILDMHKLPYSISNVPDGVMFLIKFKAE